MVPGLSSCWLRSVSLHAAHGAASSVASSLGSGVSAALAAAHVIVSAMTVASIIGALLAVVAGGVPPSPLDSSTVSIEPLEASLEGIGASTTLIHTAG